MPVSEWNFLNSFGTFEQKWVVGRIEGKEYKCYILGKFSVFHDSVILRRHQDVKESIFICLVVIG